MNELYHDPRLAASYELQTADNLCNAQYERPALHSLIGEVRGLDVLDAGCAAGAHSAWLAQNGARVVAMDVSEAMVALARRRLADRGTVVRADLAETLPFDDDAFDLVVSSLTLHYVRDWEPALREIVRVLRPGGRFVMSTHHPYITVDLVDDYFATELVEEEWSQFANEPVRVRYYHRPLERILGDLMHAGFTIRAIREPRLETEAAARDPELARRLQTRPVFFLIDAASPVA